MRIVSTSGMSSEVGLLYSSIDGILCTSACDILGGRRRNTCSSISASARPMYTLPSTWPRASTGFTVRPMSCAIQIFGPAIQPVAGSTSTSSTQAEYEYAGDGPTPAPLYLPGARGGEYEPTAPRVPNLDSANSTASLNDMPLFEADATKTRPFE